MCVDWIDLKEIYCTCQTGRYPSNLDQTKGILLLFLSFFFFFLGKCGCSGHEIMGDPCGEQAEADHEKGGAQVSTWKFRERMNYKLKLKKKKRIQLWMNPFYRISF